MLLGRFGNTSGRPYLEGRLVLTRLGLAADISFIVDTGADKTVVMPLDGTRLGVDYANLTRPFVSTGIGGMSADYLEPAILAFSETRTAIHLYQIDVIVSSPSPDIMNIPSLLGRDILDRWQMTYHKPNASLTFEVLSADYTIPL
jgi:hypothetical protein